MLAPYGSAESITGVYDLLSRFLGDKSKQAIITPLPPFPGASGIVMMPDLSGRWPGLVDEEQTYLLQFLEQHGTYAMWRVTGFTIQVAGGGFYAAVPPPVNTAGYIADGLGCVADFGLTCNPVVCTTLVDVGTNPRGTEAT